MQEWIMAKFEKEMASAPQKAVSSFRNCHIISQSSIFGRVYNIVKLKVNLIKIIDCFKYIHKPENMFEEICI